MTDKKKLEEQAILNVQTTQDGMTGETTFVADDAVALAALLKAAGLESKMFNGPAMLSVEKTEGTSSVTSRITAPDLRSIMNLLEPEFQQAGDDEVAPEEPVSIEPIAPKPMVPGAPVVTNGTAVADNTLGVDTGDDLASLDGEIEETADYDYREHDVHPQPYAGMSDRPVIQPKTKVTPARSGDNPVMESSVPEQTLDTYFRDTPATVMFDFDGGDFDTGLDYPSTANMGHSIVINSVLDDMDNELLNTLTPEEKSQLEQECYQLMVDMAGADAGMDEARNPFKTPADTEQGAIEALGHMSNYDVTGATARPDPMVKSVWLVTTKRGERAIVYLDRMDFETIDESTGPKSFKDYVREAELNELSGDLKGRYASKALDAKRRHEVKAGQADDLLWDRWARKNNGGEDSPEAENRLRSYMNRHDKIARKREKGLDRMRATTESLLDEFRMDELSRDTIQRYGRQAMRDVTARQHDYDQDMAFARRSGDDAEKISALRQGAKIDQRNHNIRGAASRLGHDVPNDMRSEVGGSKNLPRSLDRAKRWAGMEEGQHDRANDRPMPFNQACKAAQEESKAGYVVHVNYSGVTGSGRGQGVFVLSDFMDQDTTASFENGHQIGGDIQYTESESELDEAPRYGSSGYLSNMDRKSEQFGPPFFMNTDCGFASLNDLLTHDYFHGDGGVVVLEIDRNGKKGLNYVSGHDDTPVGTQVTCVTATSTGQKYRPGKVMLSFTMAELQNDRASVEKKLAQLGVSPTKKLSVKTFD